MQGAFLGFGGDGGPVDPEAKEDSSPCRRRPEEGRGAGGRAVTGLAAGGVRFCDLGAAG